jgi:hypothetical protein
MPVLSPRVSRFELIDRSVQGSPCALRCRRTEARKGEHRSGAWEAQAAIAASRDGACPARMIPFAVHGRGPSAAANSARR